MTRSPAQSVTASPVAPASCPASVALPTPALEFDVVIAGGGIVGLTLACALKDSGLRIALIEASPREAGLQFRRAYALTLMSGRIFQGLGVWQAILPHITTFKQIRLADADHPAIVDLQPEDLGTTELGYVGEHHVLVQALLHQLENAPAITWLSPATLLSADYQASHVELLVSLSEHQSEHQTEIASESQPATQTGTAKRIRSQLLIAADGKRSPIRQTAGIQTHGWQYWQSCITAVIRPEKSHANLAREHFWESGPFATLPLPDNRCQIVLTAPHAEAKRWLEADEATFLAELDRRYGGQLGKLELLTPRQLFPVQLMQSDRYILPRLALIGDAAHCCHPVGGQGLNLGIRDAAAIAQILIRAHQRSEDLGNLKVLRRYERWRKFENLIILGFTDLLDRLFSNQWLPIVTLRRLSLRLMKITKPLRTLALRLMTGLSGNPPELAKSE